MAALAPTIVAAAAVALPIPPAPVTAARGGAASAIVVTGSRVTGTAGGSAATGGVDVSAAPTRPLGTGAAPGAPLPGLPASTARNAAATGPAAPAPATGEAAARAPLPPSPGVGVTAASAATASRVLPSPDAPSAAPSAAMALAPAGFALANAGALPAAQMPAPAVPAAATPAAASPSALPVATQLAPALVAIVRGAGQAAAHLTVTLAPAELGRVQVSLHQTADGGTRMVLSAERPQTLQLLQRDQQQLHQALDQAGLPAAGRRLDFQLAPSGQDRFAGQGRAPGEAGGDGRPPRRGGFATPAATDGGSVLATGWVRGGVDVLA